jgi:site-specific DNA-methyltransferase (adenine-specific)
MINSIIHGDNMITMKEMEDNSVDMGLTDPPYGANFMGKDWDKAMPSVEMWKEYLRVLKPGAFAFIMSLPRQDLLARMIINLEDAGFMVNFSPIYWTYATGFPKAANLSKLADKRMGAERKVVGKGQKGRNLTRPPGHTGDMAIDEIHQQPIAPSITIPASPEAKALDGAYAGFQPKPCLEVALVAMKQLDEKTYLDQALSNGKGCTWLENGRIPTGETITNHSRSTKAAISKGIYGDSKAQTTHQTEGQLQGRFAPNLLVCDDVLNDGRISKSSGGSGAASMGALGKTTYGEYALDQQGAGIGGYGDSGSFSRYFDLDKWGEKNLPSHLTFPFIITPKPNPSEKNAGLNELPDKQMYKCDNSGESLEIFGSTDGGRKPRKNRHATVKPIKLGAYLVAIGSRPGDVVYDPFCGSGSFCISAALMGGRQYIGNELDGEMVDIAEKRVEWHLKQKAEEESQLEMKI